MKINQLLSYISWLMCTVSSIKRLQLDWDIRLMKVSRLFWIRLVQKLLIWLVNLTIVGQSTVMTINWLIRLESGIEGLAVDCRSWLSCPNSHIRCISQLTIGAIDWCLFQLIDFWNSWLLLSSLVFLRILVIIFTLATWLNQYYYQSEKYWAALRYL